jgi:hypothetical protein
MATFGLATILDNTDVGTEFSANHLPLHLTHIDSFDIAKSLDEITQVLREKLTEIDAFYVTATKDEMYGPNNDILVTELELTSDLINLQHILVDTMAAMGAVFKRPEILKNSFRPHVSVYGNRRVQIGDKILIKNISFAAKVGTEDNDIRRIFATLELR